MKRIVSVLVANCAKCGATFHPKPKGYNAKYCSERCKLAAKKIVLEAWRKRPEVSERKRAQRQARYLRIKKDPIKLTAHRRNSNTYRSKTRAWLAEYKQSLGCVDCGFSAHFAALQLDHTKKKTSEIANCRSSVRRLQEEIEKGGCEVRCANCHSIKTWAEKNGLKYSPGMSTIVGRKLKKGSKKK